MPKSAPPTTHGARNSIVLIAVLAIIGGGVAVFLSRSHYAAPTPSSVSSVQQPPPMPEPVTPIEKERVLEAVSRDMPEQPSAAAERAALLRNAETERAVNAEPPLSSSDKAKLLQTAQQ